jgi:hypothetical protein
MLENRYLIESSRDLMTFTFESVGPKGIVAKVVKYSPLNVKGYYNLGFGDEDPNTGYISDLATTNNSDSRKVLATVAYTLYRFTERYPDAVVIAAGSTQARTRLYRMGISNNLVAIQHDFDIAGLTENGWEPFAKGIEYLAFSVRRKLYI